MAAGGAADKGVLDDALLPPGDLRARRVGLGLTQEELGRLLGVTGNTVARWERGQQRLANPRLVALAMQRLELGSDSGASGAGRGAASRGDSRHNLPTALTSFVGRRRELGTLRQLLIAGRLVTVSGTAGIGKTRLAVEVARGLAGRFGDGVWLVELASIEDPALVVQTIAAALHIADESGRSRLETLVANLASSRTLLVLDNCEHLMEVCRETVSELLRRCARLHIMTTSRELLGVAGELTWRVPTLSLPAPGHANNVERLLRSEAVRLFVERARASQPAFDLTPANAQAVVVICEGLDGLPLALELAAARMRSLGPRQLATRMQDQLHLLVNGPKTIPSHHETLLATITWSYTLLSDPERHLFERLSVFAGGWTLEAAEAVCSFGTLKADTVIGLLGRLVDRSLVVADPLPNGKVRYRSLEPLRVYAAQVLNAADRSESECRHAAFYLEFAELAEPHLVRADQVEWMVHLEQEMPNLRSGLAWCFTHADHGVAMGLRLVCALAHFWQLGAHLDEGRGYVGRLLALMPADLPSRIEGLWTYGFLSWHAGDFPAAAAAWEDGLHCARRSATTVYLALLLIGVGSVLATLRDDPTAGETMMLEGLASARKRGDSWATGVALFWLAQTALIRGDYPAARALFEASELPARELGDRRHLAYVLLSEGHLANASGDHQAALKHFREALGIASAVGDLLGSIWMLEGLTSALAACGQNRLAARLLGTAETQRSRLGATRDPVPGWRAAREQTRNRLQHSLGDRAFMSAGAEGRRLRFELAVAEALGEVDGRGTSGVVRRPDALSTREREVALLVSRGLRNREIAGQLVLSESTVQRHVATILQKLGFSSRARIAAWVAGGGIAGPADTHN